MKNLKSREISFILLQFFLSMFVITVGVFSARFSAHRGPAGLMVYYWFSQLLINLIVTSVSAFFLGREFPVTKEKIVKKGIRSLGVFLAIHVIVTYPTYRWLYDEIINGDSPDPIYISLSQAIFSNETLPVNVHIALYGILFFISYFFFFVMNGKRFFSDGSRWDNFSESTYLFYKSILSSIRVTFYLYVFNILLVYLLIHLFALKYDIVAFSIMYYFSNDWFFILGALSLANYAQLKTKINMLKVSLLVYLVLSVGCLLITIVFENREVILMFQKEISLKHSLLAWELSARGITYIEPSILYFSTVGLFFVFVHNKQVKKLIENV